MHQILHSACLIGRLHEVSMRACQFTIVVSMSACQFTIVVSMSACLIGRLLEVSMSAYTCQFTVVVSMSAYQSILVAKHHLAAVRVHAASPLARSAPLCRQ